MQDLDLKFRGNLKSSSGTSGGVPKLIPLTTEDLEQRISFSSLYAPLLNKHIDGLSEGKSLIFYFVTRESKTANGLMVRTMVTSFLKSVKPTSSFLWDRLQISPHAITTCADTTQSITGTSGGVPKLIPLTAEELEQRILFGFLYAPLVFKHIEGLTQGKSLMFYFVTRESETASGLMVRFMITCVLKSVNPTNSFLWDRVVKDRQEAGHVPADPVVVDLVDVKIGHDYELLVTTFSGLYRGSSVSQYKTPRSVTYEEALKILESNVVSKFLSRKNPSWELHELHSSR
ncbi:unnamed protein product [Arabidopsis arenosa]|uniref:GH3 middle domain-containing protein n=1 Tax=Arabidopsis arenosa TaxID=38785 RepID=A0A8S2AH00_ARAAE|nr:unnamed protein product [Arabidopsis arenosa]